VKRPILVLLAGALLNIGLGGGAPAGAATTDSVTGARSATTAVTPAHDHDGDWYHHRYRDRDWRHHDHDGDDDDWYHHRYRDRDDDHSRHNGRQHCGGGLIVVCLL
jgi:hypothetical protein